MKGYFFRLAQHTGLRLKPQTNSAQQGGAAEPRPARAAESRHTPPSLHLEETVFVNTPPAENSAHASRPAQDSHAPPLNNQAVETSSRENNFSAHQASPAPDSSRAAFEVREVEVARKDRSASDASPAARLETQDARVLIEPPALKHEPTVREQERVPELPKIEAREAVAEGTDAVSSRSSREETSVEAREALVRTEPEHFTETAALLESGVTDREILQKVFFREIHEWIAAPTESAAELRPEPPARVENSERVSLIEADANFAQRRQRAAEKERLEQHDLSLSIGSISIVIEEPPSPPQVVQPPPRAESSRPQSTAEFSRLSRHYIR
ncbi:MAG: hypothetical protein JO360_14310 [Acidobacteria bacterium]|nr:hypothetical protein [Acidobacteriota bacterium]